MNDDFARLLAFYARRGPDATGHGQTELDGNHITLINRFIAGQCSEEERRELSTFLKENPAWLRWIEDRLKASGEESRETV
jgi:hypothetical protein